MKARITKILEQKYSRTENVYFRIYLRLETGEFAITDVVPTYRNFKFWQPVMKAGVGTIIGGVFLKEGYGKTLKVDADSEVFIIQEPLMKSPISEIDKEIYLLREGDPEIWSVIGSKGKRHKVMISTNRLSTCDCEAYRYGGGKACKHIKLALNERKKKLEEIRLRTQKTLLWKDE